MKDNLRFILLLGLITFLLNGFVSATGTGNVAEDKIANETMLLPLSFVSVPSENDQVKLANIKETLPLDIQQSIDEQIALNDNITEAIAEKEEQLVRSPLMINDSYDITDEVQTFFIGNTTTSLEPASLGSELLRETITSSAGIQPVNQIPTGGFIEFGSDGKTRVFTPRGTQIYYAVDDRTKNVTIPSGKVLPSTHIIGLPNGAALHLRGNREYITLKGKVILTIIDQPSKEMLGDSIFPSTLSYPWVEYAESDPYYIAAVHSNWIIPHSQNLGPNAANANILFNGVEPSDGSTIFQPVTAFNYYAHSSIIGSGNRTDPAIVNKWTGASWICSNLNYCTHSTPTLDFSQGELAYGAVFWYEAPVLKWLILLVNGTGQSTWLYSDRYIYSQPSRSVVTYEFGGSVPIGGTPLDSQKITSTTFSNISVWDTIGNQITTLHWNGVVNTKDHTRTTGLHVNLSQAPSTVILETDYPTVYGTGGSNVGIFRGLGNGAGVFYLRESPTETIPVYFGLSTDTPLVGDWTGTGHDLVGVWRNGAFYLRNSPTETTTVYYGVSTDTPLIGDWTGTGNDTVGVWRNGVFYLRNSPSDTTIIGYGLSTDKPVVGKWI